MKIKPSHYLVILAVVAIIVAGWLAISFSDKYQPDTSFENIIDLRHTCESKIMTMGKRAKNAQKLFTTLFSRPVQTIKSVSEILDTSHVTAANIIRDFRKMDILDEITGFKKNRLFVFKKYLGFFE